MSNVFDILFWIIYGIRIPSMLHIMQQESYQNDGMYRWIIKNPKNAFKTGIIQLFIVLASFFLSTVVTLLLVKNGVLVPDDRVTQFIPTFIAMLIFAITNIVLFIKEHKKRKEAKKPLVYTARAKRLIFFSILVIILLQAFFMQSFSNFYPNDIKEGLNYYQMSNEYAQASGDIQAQEQIIMKRANAVYYDTSTQFKYAPILYAFLVFTLPINIILGNFFGSPTENYINERYINKARKILKKKEYKDLIIIGVTGSYGKTSTKFILKTILSEKYNVLATPGSYNTTMGNVRVIREQLKPGHEVFISEMGARKRHDISKICDFIDLDIGIITSIGEQHLDTFKTIENVAKTKGELLQGVKADGAVFLPKDDSYCSTLFENDFHKNKYLFSATDSKANIYAKDIKVSSQGSTFTVVSQKNGEYTCTTRLLGEHNVQNIIGAISIAEYLGLSKELIISGVSKIEAVEHRLQLLPSTNGTTVIDDAFNSNPVGSKSALDVISKFEGRKIIITPGMVELGDKEKELNKQFGAYMAKSVDIAILVGIARSKPIEDGLLENGFDDKNIIIVKNLDEATQKLASITKAGDVILFENDLPDAYNE